MKRSVLYLGLDPSRWVTNLPIIHYPVICIKPRSEAFLCHPESTHILFTSRSAVRYWNVFEGKVLLAVGEATAELLRQKGFSPLVAPQATQEGMIELLKSLDLRGSYLIWPRSARARDVLTTYLQSLNSSTRIAIIDLYETSYQKLEPVPCLDEIEEIVFTSPSTVEGFLRIYGSLPKDKQLTAIGPITSSYLVRSQVR